MSWSIALFTLLASICLNVGDAYNMYGGMGASTPYYPPYSPFGGMDMGFMGAPDFLDDRNSGEPELLNCYASYLTPDGRGVASEMAVTIEQKPDTEGDWGNGMGFGMGVGMGMGMGMGMGYGMGDMYHGDHHESSGPGLSARVELINNVEGGKGYIVFTKTARFNDACSVGDDSKTDVLVNRRRSMGGQGMGGHGMGGHDMGGYGMGGHGGYNMMGYGMDLGMIGYGMGFGMGQGAKSMFDSDEDEGVVAEINVTPGAMTSAVIDNIGFTDLKQLAGRGVLICSSVDYDWDWNPTCEEPFYSCCNLKYDREGSTLTDNVVL